ncbi:MAG: hypothetical protein C4K58_03830 [Flavobacteriaceae bacterium]|nr:MAG: hypothetical protein C4K58_03830 [Flavobacteriaceae bacterium]
MPKISKKGALMPESPIRKLVPYSDAAKKKGRNVFHLNIGQPDIETPKEALDAIRKEDYNVLAYTHSQGVVEYREKLAKYFKEVAGIPDLTPDNFITTTGGSESLLFTLGSICDDGDQVIIPEPFYANYNGFTQSSGVEIVSIESKKKLV